MNKEISCGIITYTIKDGVVKYLVIEDHNGNIGFPKGHMEEGENEFQTALREVKEETGIEASIIPGFRREDNYIIKSFDVEKTVVYFVGTYSNQDVSCQEGEVNAIYLITYDQALSFLSFDSARRILIEANSFIESKL